MADDLPGSFEHAPAQPHRLAARDRRWCQGNLQHARLLGTAGLHPLSRLHLFMGVMYYLASPLWLLFLLAGMSLALHAYLVPPDYFLDRWSLFPDWPRIDPERAMALFGICMLVLYAPKLFGTAAFLREPRFARAARSRTVFGLLAELILSALVAPIMMLVQTSAIVQILTGRDSGWAAQARDAERVPWPLLWRFHRRHMLAGVHPRRRGRRDLLAAPGLDEPRAPRPRAGGPALGLHGQRPRRAAGWRAWACSSPPRSAAPRPSPPPPSARPRRCAPAPRVPDGLAGLLADPTALARHLAWIDPPTSRRTGQPDASLANALLKFADGFGPEALDPRETFAVLVLAPTLAGLARPPARPGRRR